MVSRRGQGLPPKTVEDSGCGVGCMTIDKKTGKIIVARDDALYYYTMDGRGPPQAYDGPKDLVSAYQEYVALVCPPASNPSRKDPEPMRRRFGGAADDFLNASTLVLLETELRIMGHSETLLSPVRAIFQIWGDMFLLLQDGKVRSSPHHKEPEC